MDSSSSQTNAPRLIPPSTNLHPSIPSQTDLDLPFFLKTMFQQAETSYAS